MISSRTSSVVFDAAEMAEGAYTPVAPRVDRFGAILPDAVALPVDSGFNE
jgi:hypothetical protein